MSEVLYSKLNAKAFLHNSYRNLDVTDFIEPFRHLISQMPISLYDKSILYRARKIDLEKDVNTGKGISLVDGILVGGFNKENSGMPKDEYCRIGRMNKNKKAVLYTAEETQTAINELKLNKGEYLSLAEFNLIKPINIIDFSARSREEIDLLINDTMEKRFNDYNSDKLRMSARELYYNVQKMFTITDSTQEFYRASNLICDEIKKCCEIDGVRYNSYRGGYNLCVWNRKAVSNIVFENSEIVKC